MAYDPALVSALEPDQLVAATKRPYPRRKLTKGVLALLVVLRVFIVIAVPIVIYAFVHALLAAIGVAQARRWGRLQVCGGSWRRPMIGAPVRKTGVSPRRLRAGQGPLPASSFSIPAHARRIAPLAASNSDFAPKAMNISPTTRVTATPWVRKKRRTAGSPAAKISVASAARKPGEGRAEQLRRVREAQLERHRARRSRKTSQARRDRPWDW